MNKLFTISLTMVLCSCYVGEELPPDQNVWEYSYPTEVGLDDDVLFEMDSSIKLGTYQQINGIIIIKDDQLVFENYYNYSGRNEPEQVGRITFALLTLALDIFVQEGYVNIDEPIHNYLPEYEDLFENDSLKRLITIRHLISFNSGLVWNETLENGNDLFRIENESDWTEYVLAKPMEAPPGLRTVINSGAGIVIAKILQNQLGQDQSLLDYLKQHFFAPIGIEEILWETDPSGTLNGSNGLLLKTRDLTRIGYMMLNEGRWSDKQRVISRDWVLDITWEQTEASTYYSYGYAWWVFTDYFSSNILRLQENTAYFASGESGQTLYVIPSERMVVCISAENYNMNFVNSSLYLFLKSLEALQPGAVN